jgi:hypothetical protein
VEAKVSKSIVEQIEDQCLLVRRDGFHPNVIFMGEPVLFAFYKEICIKQINGNNLHKSLIGAYYKGMQIMVDEIDKKCLKVSEIKK